MVKKKKLFLKCNDDEGIIKVHKTRPNACVLTSLSETVLLRKLLKTEHVPAEKATLVKSPILLLCAGTEIPDNFFPPLHPSQDNCWDHDQKHIGLIVFTVNIVMRHASPYQAVAAHGL
jgi:hypothetical protein